MMTKLITQLLLNCSSDPAFCGELARKAPTLKAAALLHDVGHFPLSHLTERIYQFRALKEHAGPEIALPDFESHLDEAAWILSDVMNPEVSQTKLSERAWNHETMGGYVVMNRAEIRDALRNAKPRVSPQEVASLIRGDSIDTSNYVFRNLMHSDLDADRLDYLERDCTEMGVVYGRVDGSYLASLLQVGMAQEAPTRKVLALAYKGLRAADHYLLARFHFYSQVIHHKTVSGFNVLAAALVLHMIDSGMLSPFDSYDAIRESVDTDDFLLFTDIRFWENVSRLLADKSEVGAWARSLYYRLPPKAIMQDAVLDAGNLSKVEMIYRRQEAKQQAADGGYDPGSLFVLETGIGLSRPSSSYFEANEEWLRVMSPKNYARCLTDISDSLSQRVTVTWRRQIVFTVNPKAFEHATGLHVAGRDAG